MNSLYQPDIEVLRRYDRPGPRYTSYPTAPTFGPNFDELMLREYIRSSNTQPTPRQLSLYVHVPYCFSPCFYCGCNRIITRNGAKGGAYVNRLVREIETIGTLFDRDREVIQLHLGGGTPNFLGTPEMSRLVESLGRHFHFSSASIRDFSIELDPRFVAEGQIEAYAQLGFNRASLGVQDFDAAVQRAVNRIQSVEQTLRIIDACRAAQFRSVNVDLIYGLPKQTIKGFGRTLKTVLAVRPDRLAIYGYAHLPALFKAQRQIAADDLPCAETRLQLLQLAIDELSAAGYVYIGMDHFALPQDDLASAQRNGGLHRNFMGYTIHSDCDLVGLGVSAISHIGDSFSQSPRDLPGWESAVDQGRLPVWRGRHLDFDDVVRGDVIQQLMCHGCVDIDVLQRRYRLHFEDYFRDALERLQPLVADGIVTVDARIVAATPRGRFLLRTIAMCFDRYLNEPASASPVPQFSRAV